MDNPQLLLVAVPFINHGEGHYFKNFGLNLNAGQSIIGIDFAKTHSSIENPSTKLTICPDVILVDENCVPHTSIINKLRDELPTNLTVHLVGHRENFMRFCRIGEQLGHGKCYSRKEASTNGLTFDLLQKLGRLRKGNNQSAYAQALEGFFHVSRLHCIEACRREILNEWDTEKLFAHRDPEKWAQLGYAWRQLLMEYPEIPKHLGEFTNLAKPEQIFHELTKLAAYLYAAPKT